MFVVFACFPGKNFYIPIFRCFQVFDDGRFATTIAADNNCGK